MLRLLVIGLFFAKSLFAMDIQKIDVEDYYIEVIRPVYQVDFCDDCEALNEKRIYKVIRKITLGSGEIKYLLVNAQSLDTFLVKGSLLEQNTKKIDDKTNRLYILLEKSKKSVIDKLDIGSQQNAKLNFAISIDLCSKPFDNHKHFSHELFKYLIKYPKPVELAIAISNRWGKKEQDKFKLLIDWKRSGLFKITWVNHTNSHPIRPEQNGNFLFMTAPDIDFNKEILEVEKILLEHGELPSLFFRFPGLVYNESLLMKLSKYSLLPLDANAWINKGKPLKNGSIALLHGNGNEKVGIIKFTKILDNIPIKDVQILNLNDNIGMNSFK